MYFQNPRLEIIRMKAMKKKIVISANYDNEHEALKISLLFFKPLIE